MANIYKLDIGEDSYIGSTNNLTKRLTMHKSRSYNERYKGYNNKIYTHIRNIGWENIVCSILETCDKEKKYEREQHFMDELNPTLNRMRAVGDPVAWHKKWDIKINCECGGHYTRSHKNRHLETKRHLNFNKEIII